MLIRTTSRLLTRAGATLLALLLASCSSGSSDSVPPSKQDSAAVTAAFNEWEGLPATCPGRILASSLHVSAPTDGAVWAVAEFGPVSDCRVPFGPEAPGGTTALAPPSAIRPWDEQQPVIAVFERTGVTWSMNGGAGRASNRIVFPCSIGPGGTPPSAGDGAIPAAVLKSWGLHPLDGKACSNVYSPPAAG
jgi:hypothetical protein